MVMCKVMFCNVTKLNNIGLNIRVEFLNAVWSCGCHLSSQPR